MAQTLGKNFIDQFNKEISEGSGKNNELDGDMNTLIIIMKR